MLDIKNASLKEINKFLLGLPSKNEIAQIWARVWVFATRDNNFSGVDHMVHKGYALVIPKELKKFVAKTKSGSARFKNEVIDFCKSINIMPVDLLNNKERLKNFQAYSKGLKANAAALDSHERAQAAKLVPVAPVPAPIPDTMGDRSPTPAPAPVPPAPVPVPTTTAPVPSFDFLADALERCQNENASLTKANEALVQEVKRLTVALANARTTNEELEASLDSAERKNNRQEELIEVLRKLATDMATNEELEAFNNNALTI